jgi:hypothetical protein
LGDGSELTSISMWVSSEGMEEHVRQERVKKMQAMHTELRSEGLELLAEGRLGVLLHRIACGVDCALRAAPSLESLAVSRDFT